MADTDQFLEAAAEVMAALDDVPSPAALLDEEGMIRWQNKASLKLRGRRVGSSFADFIAPQDQTQARSLFERVLARGSSSELTVRALNARGEYVALNGRWSIVQVRNGAKVVVVLSLGDQNGSPAPPNSAKASSQLTPRQHDVLQLLAAGRSTNEIAATLSLTETTVRNHIANLLGALGAHSRLQAVVAAREAGLVDP